MKKHTKNKLSLIIFVFIMGILILLLIDNTVCKKAERYINIIDDGFKADAIIILGAYVNEKGQPSPMLKDRLDAGIKAYNEGIAERILLTGDHGQKDYDEVNGMKEYVLAEGIPKEDVFLDHAGFSTYDSIYRAKEIFLIKDAVIITQEYHLKRAVYIALKTGINARGISSDLREYPKLQMQLYELREKIARIKDFFLVNILKPKPKFLGETISIFKDSSICYD